MREGVIKVDFANTNAELYVLILRILLHLIRLIGTAKKNF